MTQALNLFDALALMCVGVLICGFVQVLSSIRSKRSDEIAAGAFLAVAIVLILGYYSFGLFKDPTAFWTAAAAIATTFAASAALWVGLEPRRLAEKNKRDKAMSLAILLAAELQQAYTVYKGVKIAISQQPPDSIVTETLARWVQFYVTRADMPTLAKLSSNLDVFEPPLSWKLAALSVDHNRTQEAFAPGGIISAILFDDMKAPELSLMPETALETVEECWHLIHEIYGTKIEQLNAELSAAFIAKGITSKTEPPRTA